MPVVNRMKKKTVPQSRSPEKLYRRRPLAAAGAGAGPLRDHDRRSPGADRSPGRDTRPAGVRRRRGAGECQRRVARQRRGVRSISGGDAGAGGTLGTGTANPGAVGLPAAGAGPSRSRRLSRVAGAIAESGMKTGGGNRRRRLLERREQSNGIGRTRPKRTTSQVQSRRSPTHAIQRRPIAATAAVGGFPVDAKRQGAIVGLVSCSQAGADPPDGIECTACGFNQPAIYFDARRRICLDCHYASICGPHGSFRPGTSPRRSSGAGGGGAGGNRAGGAASL